MNVQIEAISHLDNKISQNVHTGDQGVSDIQCQNCTWNVGVTWIGEGWGANTGAPIMEKNGKSIRPREMCNNDMHLCNYFYLYYWLDWSSFIDIL